MMKNELLAVSLRKNAIFIPADWCMTSDKIVLQETTSVLVANCNRLGFGISEELLWKLNSVLPKYKLEVLQDLKEVLGVNKNWTPLVKQWDIPTGETILDHVTTWFANVFQSKNGTKLPCGHLIPENTFPLHRYNGCPFCGTPHNMEKLEYAQNGKLKVLELWNEDHLKDELVNLLNSPVALDASQVDSLKILLRNVDLPKNIEIQMKETQMLVIDTFQEMGAFNKAGTFFQSPNDILRYLWYKQTGFLQIVKPKTIVNRKVYNTSHFVAQKASKEHARMEAISELKLKFTRFECKQYATWMNRISMNIKDQCEMMHPKREMWVRVIRALRLAEYSKRKGFENLAQLLDVFYHKKYDVWSAKVTFCRNKLDVEGTFELLKQRPGQFARSLFSNMLWFGPDISLEYFKEIMNQVPPRLIFTLNMYAEFYFNRNGKRAVKPLGGVLKKIPTNQLLEIYSDDELQRMKVMIKDLSLDLIKSKFAAETNSNKTIFVDNRLFRVPLAIGDRNEQIQDLTGSLMGDRFEVKGDRVRLFLQWGEGLPAQHLDMDLSCMVSYENRNEFCSYSKLVIPGCKHSGDIQSIPNQVGTAEYIEIDLKQLDKMEAKYVSFTCNAYTNGSLSPNLIVGWMNSQYPMKISRKGVAFNPHDVQHQVRIKQGLDKGLLFGVLDVEKREIIWLEMGFNGQVVQNLSFTTVEAMIDKLDAKIKIGDLLNLKAEVQGLELVSDSTNADEIYDLKWASNTGKVSNMFLQYDK